MEIVYERRHPDHRDTVGHDDVEYGTFTEAATDPVEGTEVVGWEVHPNEPGRSPSHLYRPFSLWVFQGREWLDLGWD